MLKKSLSITIFVLLASLLVVAVVAAADASQDKEKIVFIWPFAHAVELHAELQDEFNASHDDIELEIQVIPQADAVPKMTTLFSAGEGPDVVALSPMWLAQFAAAGWLESLEDFVASDPMMEDLAPISFTSGRMYQNELYMLGHILGVYPLFYNVELFEAAGLPGPPATIEEFREYAIALTDPAKNQYGYYQIGGSGWAFQQWSLWAINNGGIGVNNSLYDEDGVCIFRGEAHKEGIQDFVDLYQVDMVSPPASANGGFAEAKAAFCAGQIGMVMGFLPYYSDFADCMEPEQFGLAKTPEGAAGSFYHYGANGYAINASTENKEAAWEVVKFFMDPDVNSRIGEAFAALPTNTKAFDADWLSATHFDAAKEMAANPEMIHTARELPEWANFQGSYSPEQMQLLLLGEQTLDEFVENVCVYLEDAKAAFEGGE